MKIKEYLEKNHMGSPYLKYAANKYTQCGEDGIIEKILEELNIKSGLVLEFGAWDGIYLSNAFNLWANGEFKCILIEPEKERFNDLLKLTMGNTNVECFDSFVVPNTGDYDSLDSIIRRSKFKDENFVLLSIDVDSNDYHLFDSLESYKPIVLVIETNTDYPPPIENTNGSCSIESIKKLAERKGYSLVASTGNCIFVLNDFIGRLKEHDYSLSTSDYYINTEVVEKIMQRIDQEGNITESYYYKTPQYLDFIQSEKDRISNGN